MGHIGGDKFMTDSNVQSQGFHHVIIEVKNEIGSLGAKPHTQAISYYIHTTKSSVIEPPGFRFPCILITLFSKVSTLYHYLSPTHTILLGAHIGFSAAVWSTRPNVLVLLMALPLFWHHMDTRMCMMAMCHLGTLRNALCSLKQCYNKGLSNMIPPTQPAPNLEFPYPFLYTCINILLMCNIRSPTLWQERRVLSIQMLNNPTKVCARITQQNLFGNPLFVLLDLCPKNSNVHRLLFLTVIVNLLPIWSDGWYCHGLWCHIRHLTQHLIRYSACRPSKSHLFIHLRYYLQYTLVSYQKLSCLTQKMKAMLCWR